MGNYFYMFDFQNLAKMTNKNTCLKLLEKKVENILSSVRGGEALITHPPPDSPQKKNQTTHLGDPQNYQVEGINIPKQEVDFMSISKIVFSVKKLTFLNKSQFFTKFKPIIEI